MKPGSIYGLILFLFFIRSGWARAEAAWQWGRDLEGERTFQVGVTIGRISNIKGEVEETVRPYYELTDQSTPGENYSLSDFGLDENISTYGFHLEQKWKYATLQMNASYFYPRAKSVAIRDYYLGIEGEIEFSGQNYEYMVIPEGRDFEAKMEDLICDLRLLITPGILRLSPNFQFVPSIYTGIAGLISYYYLDAGPSTGVVAYENPPREYVVGGRTEGWAGLGVPGFGLGGEMRIGNSEGVRLVLQGHYAFFAYDGSTKYIPIEIRHEKELELNYGNYEVRGVLEFPFSRKLDFFLGFVYQHLAVDASVAAQERSEEEIEELREKYDKEMDFELSAFAGTFGFRF